MANAKKEAATDDAADKSKAADAGAGAPVGAKGTSEGEQTAGADKGPSELEQQFDEVTRRLDASNAENSTLQGRVAQLEADAKSHESAIGKARKEGFTEGEKSAREEIFDGATKKAEKDEAAGDAIFLRGHLAAALIHVPAAMRVSGDVELLNQTEAFVHEIADEPLTRAVAVQLIQAIAEKRPAEIVSGAYRPQVDRMLRATLGQDVPAVLGNTDAGDPKAAQQRMNAAIGGGGSYRPPAEVAAEEQALADSMAAAALDPNSQSAEQRRLYSGN